LPFTSTSVVQKSNEIGETAAKLLIKYMKNRSIGNEKIMIECDIIERESTQDE